MMWTLINLPRGTGKVGNKSTLRILGVSVYVCVCVRRGLLHWFGAFGQEARVVEDSPTFD